MNHSTYNSQTSGKLSKEHFLNILKRVEEQVFGGKGVERHGRNGIEFKDQPWKYITDGVGEGFLLGQALKKVIELAGFEDYNRIEREALGAIAYIAMFLMWKENQNSIEPAPHIKDS